MHWNGRVSPQIFLSRMKDSNFKFVKHLEYSVHFRILISFF
jgi:hypothetical protein